MPTVVAGRCWSEPTMRVNGTIVPSTTMASTSAQAGSSVPLRFPSSEIVSPSSSRGKLHHGWATAQKRLAKRKP